MPKNDWSGQPCPQSLIDCEIRDLSYGKVVAFENTEGHSGLRNAGTGGGLDPGETCACRPFGFGAVK